MDHGQGMTTLKINLATAWDNCGFHLAPFDHIIRRQGQKTSSQRSNSSNHILSSHIRFVLEWFYSVDKEQLVNSLQDCDTICVMSVAILMDVHNKEQLSFDSIMRDLETICQLPKVSRSLFSPFFNFFFPFSHIFFDNFYHSNHGSKNKQKSRTWTVSFGKHVRKHVRKHATCRSSTVFFKKLRNFLKLMRKG
jgi:hypothetical protein